MPRKGKGSSVNNRTDLAMPVTTVPGQEYGKQIAQAQAQKIVPMGPTPNVPAPAAAPQPQSPGIIPQAQPMFAGSLNWHGPTERPAEPIQAGLPTGPGPGPEILGTSKPPAVGDALQNMAFSGVPNTLIAQLANASKILGI